MTNIEIAIVFFVAIIFLVAGYFLKAYILIKKKNFIEIDIEKKKVESEKEIQENKKKAQEKIDKKNIELDEKEKRLAQKDDFLLKEQKNLSEKKDFLDEKEKKIISDLEKISGLTKQEALEKIKKKVEQENSEDFSVCMRKMEGVKKEGLEKKAREIIALSIQKYSKNLENNLVTSSVQIPEDEKGKIIGKEGRNIKTFEKETGVQLLVDQKLNEVVISSFDPIRREVAVISLENLLKDGVVHPSKIEEYVSEARDCVIGIIERAGVDAAQQVGLINTPKEVLNILGRLHFRSSYGQNVLKHSIEMAHIAEVIAQELGADVYVAKAGALFHDIGKAVDFETKGTHVEIGRKILRKYSIDEEIIKAMQTHHREYPNENIESYIVDAADSISGSRPGARSDNADMYIKKLEGLEKITKEFDGVSNSYTLSAGREVRVFVKPDEVDDTNAAKMARDIAIRIEDELKYPGEIKVAVIREKKVVEFAR